MFRSIHSKGIGSTIKTLLLSLALVALAFVSCTDSSAPTSSTNASAAWKAFVGKELPFDFGCGQWCAECECVCISGTFHVVDNGKGFHIVAKGSGTGIDCETGAATGTTYTWHDVINANNGASVQTTHLTSKDGGCDFTLRFTMNANGELVVLGVDCD